MPHLRLAALLTAATLLAAGCSDDDPQPRVEPPPSATPTASPSPTEPTATSSAPAALNPVQTVRAWVAARNVTLSSGDSKAVDALSTDACKTCRDLVEPFVALYADGGSMKTTGWKVDNAKKRPDFEKSHQVFAALTFAGGETITQPGQQPEPFDPEKHILQFKLARTEGLWRVADVVFLP
ncbi:DUF6318 family protein [Nocardioides lijunqiniae]|uniref:DUF6318 family protein n=1 Tax=Nocardioides lijunqiniae TaxID=2760832 RepID=UPI0018778561|nr:DUF6318 family protein [Nocardioides lijunqiniae]